MPLQIPPQNIAETGVQPPDPMQRISGMLDMQNKQNQNQLGKIATQSNQANLDEENGVRSVIQNIKQYQDPQGNIDFNSIGPDIMKAAPTKGGSIIAGLMGAQTASVGARQAAAGLNQTYKQQVAQQIGSMAGNGATPEQNVAQLDALGKSRPELAPIIDYMKNYTLGPALKSGDPKAVDQAFLHAATSIMSPGEQVQANTPSGIQVGNGQQTSVVNTAPLAGPIGAPIAGTLQQQQVPPSQVSSIETDVNGNKVVVNKAPLGGIASTGPVPGGRGGFQSLPPGETLKTQEAASNIRLAANAAASSSPDQQFNANQIIDYAQKGLTGKGSQFFANLRGGMTGIHGDNSDSAATNTQLLGHAIAQQQGTLAASAGLTGSNAKMALAGEQTADGKWTTDAIQSSARVMRALGSTGTNLYNQGIENASNAGGPFAAREFQNKWSQTASVDSIRLYDAVKNQASDPAGLKQVVDSMGGPNSSRFQFAQKKINSMKALIQGNQ